MRDYAQIMGDGIIDDKIADKALTMLDVDHEGLDYVDQKILRTMIEMYGGGPVGLASVFSKKREPKGYSQERRQTSFLAFVFCIFKDILSYHLLFHPKFILKQNKKGYSLSIS